VRHKRHIERLEQVHRALSNEQIDFNLVDDIKETLECYLVRFCHQSHASAPCESSYLKASRFHTHLHSPTTMHMWHSSVFTRLPDVDAGSSPCLAVPVDTDCADRVFKKGV
jgi:hypothetical protein